MILLAQRLIDHRGVDAARSDDTVQIAKELDRLCTYHRITQDHELAELVTMWARAHRRFKDLSEKALLIYPDGEKGPKATA